MTSREYTSEEVRGMFLNHLKTIVNYWSSESRTNDKKEAMDGLVHSILSTIDGCSANLPAFSLIPNPRPTDKEYFCGLGENYFPEPDLKNDISGGLHDDWGGGQKVCKP